MKSSPGLGDGDFSSVIFTLVGFATIFISTHIPQSIKKLVLSKIFDLNVFTFVNYYTKTIFTTRVCNTMRGYVFTSMSLFTEVYSPGRWSQVLSGGDVALWTLVPGCFQGRGVLPSSVIGPVQSPVPGPVPQPGQGVPPTQDSGTPLDRTLDTQLCRQDRGYSPDRTGVSNQTRQMGTPAADRLRHKIHDLLRSCRRNFLSF